MSTTPKSAKKLPFIDLHSDDDKLRKAAKTLLNYSKKYFPNSLVEELFQAIECSPPGSHYETLKACSSCVSSLAGLLFPKNEWVLLFHLMFEYLGTNSSNGKLCVMLLWNELIPKCPEVFVPYVDFLIEGFTDLMPTILEDHRCRVAAARASVKLILYYSTPASYCKFYGLLEHVIVTLFVAIGEEDLVCSLLEDLIVLVGVETAVFKVNIGVVVKYMVRIAENSKLGEKLRQLSIEFIVTLAEDREIGCGMMQMVPKEEVTKLLSVLIVMLVHIKDDPCWGNANSDDENEGQLSMCSYAMESLDRLAIALGGSVIVPCCAVGLFDLFHDQNWRIRHAAVTAIGLISEGCSKALLLEMEKLVQTIVKLIHDEHPRVCWAKIRTIGQLSTYLSPCFQEQYHQQLLRALIEVLDDIDNPRLQTRAASAIQLFSQNCSADVLKPYLHNTVRKLVGFLQRGTAMMKEASLATLASLAISSQEDSAYLYDSLMPYLKVILETVTNDTSRTLLAKSMECITMAAMAVGNLAINDYVEKVTAVLISLHETQTVIEDPMRRLLLLECGRLCKFLGADFLPYLSLVMPVALKSALLKNYLSVSDNSDTDDSDYESMIKATAGNKKIGIRAALLEEKALACHMLCFFSTELKEGLHLWVNEVVSALVQNLTFKFSEEIRMAAVSAMPLLLNSASCAMKKGLLVTGHGKSPVQKLSDTIISSLLDALKKVPGSCLSKHQAEKFVDGISKVLSRCSYRKTEREKRAKEHTDSREQELLKEEAEQHLTICRNIGICLGTMVKKLKASFLPHFDKFLPYVSLMWIVATAIGICAEFGADFLKPHIKGILGHLKTALENPNAKHPDNIMAYEAAVSTCGKLNQFVSEGISYEYILLWLNHLPITCDLDEAKISHELLCSMMETSEQKVIGLGGSYIPIIIAIFAEVLWAGNNLASEETRTRIINLLKKFQRELEPLVLSKIFETLPLPHQNMLRIVLST
uniref:Karyopherin-beta 3 variant n=1 Tax=Solanum tuberosum TaxID=4113 RepID=M1CW37_SOLTU